MSVINNVKKSSRDIIAIAVTLALLCAGLLGLFNAIDSWATLSFARPVMASALVAVVDAALMVSALCLAPLVSKLVRLSIGRR
jgi:hypothetical protein